MFTRLDYNNTNLVGLWWGLHKVIYVRQIHSAWHIILTNVYYIAKVLSNAVWTLEEDSSDLNDNDVDNDGDDEDFYCLLSTYFVKGTLRSFTYSDIQQMFIEHIVGNIRNWVKQG